MMKQGFVYIKQRTFYGAYYAVLAEKNFVNLDDIIKNFSKFGSKYIGHPNNKLPGIEMIRVL